MGARRQGVTYHSRARHSHLRTKIPRDFLQGRAAMGCRGAGPWTRRATAGEVRTRKRRQRSHAVLPGAEDRRVVAWVPGRLYQMHGVRALPEADFGDTLPGA